MTILGIKIFGSNDYFSWERLKISLVTKFSRGKFLPQICCLGTGGDSPKPLRMTTTAIWNMLPNFVNTHWILYWITDFVELWTIIAISFNSFLSEGAHFQTKILQCSFKTFVLSLTWLDSQKLFKTRLQLFMPLPSLIKALQTMINTFLHLPYLFKTLEDSPRLVGDLVRLLFRTHIFTTLISF